MNDMGTVAVTEKLNSIRLTEKDDGPEPSNSGSGAADSPSSSIHEGRSFVQVHSLTESPQQLYRQLSETEAWKGGYNVLKNEALTEEPKAPGHVRFVCISDTHNQHDDIELPKGDVLLHAGDFTWKGTQQEVKDFSTFLQKIKKNYKHIVVIAGNHELAFDDMKPAFFGLSKKKAPCDRGSELKAMLKKHCIYLEDESVELMGFRIHGSPWQPYHRGWAFNLPRGEPLLEKWNKIPNNTDILITHGPPLGHGDMTFMRKHVGCVELLSTIQQRVKPRLNLFGHIHEGHGITTDGTTIFVNAAICNFRYQPTQSPIVVDLPVRSDV